MIVYEKRAPLPLLSSPSAQIVKCIVIIQIYFPLLKAKLYLKISIHACFMTHTCNFLYLAIHLHKMEQIFVIYPFQQRLPSEMR